MRPPLVLLVSAAVFVLSAVVLLLVLPDDPGRALPVLALALALALIAASFLYAVGTFTRLGVLRRTADPDTASQREIARAVMRNDDSQLDDAQLHRSARYAAAVAEFQPAMYTEIALVLAAVVALQFSSPEGFADDLVLFRTGLVALVALSSLVLGPIIAHQIRAVRRYVREHPVDATAGFEPAK